ncbi:MAG: Zeta toxin family protein [Deltaproteobacteria bacterium]|nr:MAG: Zeta toxin family protein [Deltaproteobacteria bacterium]
MFDKAGKRVVIIAGPNGAGKTTFANEFLPNEAGLLNFINADLIAAGLSPYAPEKAAIRAGRIMIEIMAERVRSGKSFAFESTLSGRGYLRHIVAWQQVGYFVKLIYLSLASPEIALARIRQRVREGGHPVPEAVVRRRFEGGLYNFNRFYRPLVDQWALYDNSRRKPVLISEGAKT